MSGEVKIRAAEMDNIQNIAGIRRKEEKNEDV